MAPSGWGCRAAKTDKTRRRITFEALDSGIPSVANVGNLGDVCVAWLLRGETPRHSWLISGRRALSAFIVLIRLVLVKVFFALCNICLLRSGVFRFHLGRRCGNN